MAGPGSLNAWNVAPGGDVDLKKKMAFALMQQGMDASPAGHWTAALARAVQGGMGGYLMNAANEEDEADAAKTRQIMAALSGGTQTVPQTPVPQAPIDPARAISGIESGGKYDALGPMTNGDRAYGKYQVMGANIGPWSKQHFGQELTPEQFIANPQAQDAIFKGQFGQYVKQYGSPEAAARAWFAGPGGMNNPGAKDVLGTTVADYSKKFTQALGPTAPVGTPVDQPRGGMPDDRRMQMIQALSQTRRGAPFAQQLFAKEIEREATRTRPLTDQAQRAAYGIPEADKNAYQIDALGKISAVNPQPYAVNINNQAESEFSKESAKLQAKRFNDLADDAPSVTQMKSDLAMLRDLGEKIQTSKLAEVKAVIGPWSSALGMDVKGLNEIQAYEAIVNRLAPNLRVKGSGAQSDFELRNFMKSLPTLGNNPEGNEIATRVLEGMYQNKMAAAEIGSKALTGELTRSEAEKQLRSLPDPMKEWREFNKKGNPASKPVIRLNDDGSER